MKRVGLAVQNVCNAATARTHARAPVARHGALHPWSPFCLSQYISGPTAMKEIAGDTLLKFHNQYPSLLGIPELRQAIARHSETYQGLPVDWETEVLVTVGATEAIASVFLGLLNPGDEVTNTQVAPQPAAAVKQQQPRQWLLQQVHSGFAAPLEFLIAAGNLTVSWPCLAGPRTSSCVATMVPPGPASAA
jgi:hypothetical protein